MFGNWDMMDGWGGAGLWMPVAVLLIALIIVVGVWLIIRSGRVRPGTEPTAADVLGQRFARGEITKEEYEAAKRALDE